MRKYLVNFNLSFRLRLAYQKDWLVTIPGLLLNIGIYYYLWRVLSIKGAGITPDLLTTYSILGLILSRCLDSGVSFSMSERIKTGSIVVDLLRPTDYQVTAYMQSLGQNLNELVIIGLPLYAIASLLFPVAPPASFASVLFFILTILAGALIGASLNFLFGILSFWTTNPYNISRLKQLAIHALSGALVPVMIFPVWLASALGWLPFVYMVNLPVQVYLGQIDFRAALNGIAIQLVWAALLSLAGRFLANKAFANLTFQGG